MTPSELPTGEHPVPERQDASHDNRLLYAIVGLLVVVLLVIAAVAYSEANDDAEAHRKAELLQETFRHAGLRTAPDIDVITRSLGTDGGAVCKTAGSDLGHALLDQQLVAGAGGVGGRAIRVDRDVLNGNLAIVSVYCPKRLGSFLRYFQDYDVDDVIRD